METKVATNWRELLEAAENGHAREICEMLNGDSGAAACLLKGYAIYTARPEEAKDLFAQARRSEQIELSQEAAVFEARCYEYLGQFDNGKVLIRSLLRQKLLPAVHAHALFVFSVLQVGTPVRALKTLLKIRLEDLTLARRARVLYWRAKLQSDLKKFDLALVDYAGAAAYFELAGNLSGVAHAWNNVASVQRKLKRFEDAHESADKALALLPKDDPFLANFLNLKAAILLSERRFAEAESVARRAVGLVEGSDRLGVLCENLCTLARSLAAQRAFADASIMFKRAQEIAEQLDSPHALFTVTSARKDAAQEFIQSAEVELAELALQMCDGSYRTAAKKLDLTHTSIRKILKQSNSKWKRKKPQSLIRKTVS